MGANTCKSHLMKNTKVVLITGGIGDIGTAIAKQLDSNYSHVIALDIATEDDVKQWLSKLAEEGFHHVMYRKMDVTNFEGCNRVIADIHHKFSRIDALINNAGITRDAVFHKMTEEQWNTVLTVNLDGMFNVTRNVVEYMRKQQEGRIINISSVNAQKGQFSQANYAASKAGIYGFTKSLAQELMVKNITVNSISPGYVDTHLMQGIRPDILKKIIEQIPAKRLAKPEEIAWAVQFLLDDRSQYITGANLSINGGLHMY
jgi:acetoacetyl-CoA reductase